MLFLRILEKKSHWADVKRAPLANNSNAAFERYVDTLSNFLIVN